MGENLHETVRKAPVENATPSGPIVCPQCAKVLDGEPNFCPACGGDMRGLTGTSDTLSGPLKDQLIDGRYKILEKLGDGGMGSVFKVEHVRMGKIAALKLMRPDTTLDKPLKQRFLQEARVVAKLSYANTVQVFDTGELEDGSLYIAMEYVPGKDLAWHLKAHGPLSEEKAIGLGIQVLSSLAEAHEEGIVHRDIKPANIMLVRRRKHGEDQVKLLDFGIAKLLEAEGRKSTTGDFIGTPSYMSPEQIAGTSIDPRSDLYSLGAVLFELVTGKQLYSGPTPFSIITQHSSAPVPKVAEVAPDRNVSPAFEAVLRKALAKKPADRYADADAMRAALEQLRREMGALPNELTPMPQELAEKMLSREDFDRFERKLKLQRSVAPFVALCVVLAAGGVGAHLWSSHASQRPVTAEREPNDNPGEATAIAPGTDVTGSIGAAAAGKGDRDLYLLPVQAGPHRVRLTAVPDLNLTLEVLQLMDGKLTRLVFLDDTGPGHDEQLDALSLSAGEVYLRVEEKAFVTESNRPPREKSLVPYTLRLEPLTVGPGLLETEPNDTFHTAQALPLTRAVTAYTGARVDDFDRLQDMRPDAPFTSADWFRVDDVPVDEEAFLVVVPPERGALLVVDGAALEAWQQRKSQATPRAPVGPAPSGVLVQGSPKLVKLEPTTTGPRRVRVLPVEDTLPGASYQLAAATGGANGLAGLLDLARTLKESNQSATRRALLEAASDTFKRSPDLTLVTQLLEQR